MKKLINKYRETWDSLSTVGKIFEITACVLLFLGLVLLIIIDCRRGNGLLVWIGVVLVAAIFEILALLTRMHR